MKRIELANIVYAKAQELRKEADRLARVAHQIETGALKDGDAVGDAMRLRLDSKLGYGTARTKAYDMFRSKSTK